MQSPRRSLLAVVPALLLLLTGEAHGHLQDTCPSVDRGRDVFTRASESFEYTDVIYFWAASYNVS